MYTQERSETQLHAVRGPAKVLGFTSYLFDVTYMEKIRFSVTFQGFGGIRSTLGKHPSKNTYGDPGQLKPILQ